MNHYYLISILLIVSCQPIKQKAEPQIQIIKQATTTSVGLRGLSVVDESIAWASGAEGTYLRTTNGETWQSDTVEGTSAYQFRDVEAFSKDAALLLTAGNPAKIYKTTDGGATWLETYSNTTEGIFFDAMDFWDNEHGIAFSDAVNGHLVVIVTDDGGSTWKEISYEGFPTSPDEGEGGFAASGTCLTTFGDSLVWIGLGSPHSRVFKSADRGESWWAIETPMKGSTSSAGIFSLEFISPSYGIAVGGDYELKDSIARNAMMTKDGGTSWQLLGANGPKGYRSAITHVPETDLWLAAGRGGVDISTDNGVTWSLVDTIGYYTIQMAGPHVGYATGSEGRIAKILINPEPSLE